MNLRIYPGSKEIQKEANELFTESKVVYVGYPGPVILINLTEEEKIFATEYFQEKGKTTKEE